jgi:hypothetical protein
VQIFGSEILPLINITSTSTVIRFEKGKEVRKSYGKVSDEEFANGLRLGKVILIYVTYRTLCNSFWV